MALALPWALYWHKMSGIMKGFGLVWHQIIWHRVVHR